MNVPFPTAEAAVVTLLNFALGVEVGLTAAIQELLFVVLLGEELRLGGLFVTTAMFVTFCDLAAAKYSFALSVSAPTAVPRLPGRLLA